MQLWTTNGENDGALLGSPAPDARPSLNLELHRSRDGSNRGMSRLIATPA
jgi:hypothetical protein